MELARVQLRRIQAPQKGAQEPISASQGEHGSLQTPRRPARRAAVLSACERRDGPDANASGDAVESASLPWSHRLYGRFLPDRRRGAAASLPLPSPGHAVLCPVDPQ